MRPESLWGLKTHPGDKPVPVPPSELMGVWLHRALSTRPCFVVLFLFESSHLKAIHEDKDKSDLCS